MWVSRWTCSSKYLPTLARNPIRKVHLEHAAMTQLGVSNQASLAGGNPDVPAGLGDAHRRPHQVRWIALWYHFYVIPNDDRHFVFFQLHYAGGFPDLLEPVRGRVGDRPCWWVGSTALEFARVRTRARGADI